jgi:hypothetical protein
MAILKKGIEFESGEQITAVKLNKIIEDAEFESTAVEGPVLTVDSVTGRIVMPDGVLSTAKLTTAALANLRDAANLAGTLSVDRIASGSITNAKLASGIDASKLTSGTLPAARIDDDSIEIAKLTAAALANLRDADNLTGASNLVTAGFFESDELEFTGSGTTLTQAHGLGGVPILAQVILRCKTTEYGYAVGDEIQLSSIHAVSNNHGITTSVNATNIIIRQFGDVYVHNRSAVSMNLVTPANWRWVLRAWR